MIDPEKRNLPLSRREKLAVRLLLFIIAIVTPWQFAHQYSTFVDELKKELE